MFDLLNQLPNFVTFTKYYTIGDNLIRQIASIAKMSIINQYEVLFQVGDQSDAFYIIIKGTITIREKIFGTLDFGDEINLSIGHCFGEFGLLYSLPRNQTCIAGKDSILLYLTKESFNKILKVSKIVHYIHRNLCSNQKWIEKP